MSNAIEAADFIKRQLALMRGYEQLAGALDRIGSIEQATKEAQDARAAAELDRDVALSDLNKINTEIDEAKDEAVRILTEVRESTQNHANKIIGDARDEADRIISTATGNARQALAGANAKADQVRADYQAMQALTDGLKEMADSQRESIAAAQKEFDRINGAIEQLKAKLI